MIVTTNGLPSNGVNLNIWQIDQVTSSANSSYPSLVLDGSNNIYASWVTTGGSDKYVRFNKGTYSGGAYTWGTMAQVDVNAGAGPLYTSVGVAGSNVYVAYWHPASGLKVAKSTNGGTSFPSNVVVAAGGTYPSLEVYYNSIAGQDYVYVAYYASGTGDLVLAKSTDSGATFTPETIDSTGDVGNTPPSTSTAATTRTSPITMRPTAGASAPTGTRVAAVAHRTVDSIRWREYSSIASAATTASTSPTTTAARATRTTRRRRPRPRPSTLRDCRRRRDHRLVRLNRARQLQRSAHCVLRLHLGRSGTRRKPQAPGTSYRPGERQPSRQTLIAIGIDSADVQRIGYIGGGDVKIARYLP